MSVLVRVLLFLFGIMQSIRFWQTVPCFSNRCIIHRAHHRLSALQKRKPDAMEGNATYTTALNMRQKKKCVISSTEKVSDVETIRHAQCACMYSPTLQVPYL